MAGPVGRVRDAHRERRHRRRRMLGGRRFYDFLQATGSPIAAEALRRIAELYAVEKRIRGQPAEARRRTRQADARPLIEAMKPLFETELLRIP